MLSRVTYGYAVVTAAVIAGSIVVMKRGSMYDASEYESMSIQRLARAAGIVAALTVVSKVLGFFREVSLASVFGATADVDAFLVAQTIPFLFLSIVSYALTTTFIPVYAQIREEQGHDQAVSFANTAICLAFVIGILLVISGEIVAEKLVQFTAPGFDQELIRLTTYLSRIIFPMMAFQLVSGIMTGILQSNQNFAIPTTASLFQNIAIIVSTLLFGRSHGIVAVAIGLLVGVGLAVVFKALALHRMGFRWQWRLAIWEPRARRMFTLMLPAIVGSGASQLNVLVDRILASGLSEGRIAALNYANKLAELAPGILGLTIVTVIYPTLTEKAARKDWRGLAEGTVDALNLIYFLLAPIAVGVLVLREPLVRIVYERGVFDVDATVQTAWALLFLSLGIGISSMQRLMERVFFAIQNTKVPAMIGVVTVGLNIILNILLIGPLEQGGLALGTVLATTAGLILSIWFFRRRSPEGFPVSRFVNSIVQTGLRSLCMGVVVYVIYPWTSSLASSQGTVVELIRVGVASGLGCVVYAGLAWAMKAPELKLVCRLASRALS